LLRIGKIKVLRIRTVSRITAPSRPITYIGGGRRHDGNGELGEYGELGPDAKTVERVDAVLEFGVLAS